MKEDLITFETAKLAKEKGLPKFLDRGSNLMCYDLLTGKVTCYHIHIDFPSEDEYLYAPTQTLLQKWLRETHKIDVVIGSSYIGYNVVLWDRNKNKTHHVEPINICEKYEDVLEIGLEKALKLIDLNK